MNEQDISQMVESCWGILPYSSFHPLAPKEHKILFSVIAGTYLHSLDGENAFEILQQKAAEPAAKQHQKLFQDTVGTFTKSAACGRGGEKIIWGLLGTLFVKNNLFLRSLTSSLWNILIFHNFFMGI
ncbi:helicase HerA-like domain-containing protein [Acinetobacter sp. RF15A]|uniref:helicase HerA-like domain-containing protein n=1 Tax=Acinetobacter sp. RF15A TaxID=2650964 RepID=UPI001D0D8F40|nr:helicase HerA-like domain-containing protein [Acinetobacter sp. RF15A]